MTNCSRAAMFAVLGVTALIASPVLAETPVATAVFKCQGGKSIELDLLCEFRQPKAE